MLRMTITAVVLAASAPVATADPPGLTEPQSPLTEPPTRLAVHFASDYLTGLGEGVGFGLEVETGPHAVSVDLLGSFVPICYNGCLGFWSAEISLAYHHRVGDRFFAGLRIAAFYDSAIPDMASDMGWWTMGLAELGYRIPDRAWNPKISLGAGAVEAPYGKRGPIAMLRFSISR